MSKVGGRGESNCLDCSLPARTLSSTTYLTHAARQGAAQAVLHGAGSQVIRHQFRVREEKHGKNSVFDEKYPGRKGRAGSGVLLTMWQKSNVEKVSPCIIHLRYWIPESESCQMTSSCILWPSGG